MRALMALYLSTAILNAMSISGSRSRLSKLTSLSGSKSRDNCHGKITNKNGLVNKVDIYLHWIFPFIKKDTTRITESSRHKQIREILLTEAVYKPIDLPSDVYVKIKKITISCPSDEDTNKAQG